MVVERRGGVIGGGRGEVVFSTRKDEGGAEGKEWREEGKA